MAKKLRMNGLKNRTIEEIFADFVRSQSAKGLAETTIRNYSLHLHNISKHLDIQQPMDSLNRRQLFNSSIIERLYFSLKKH